MKILVTGGGGYVGNVLCRKLLKNGYEVRCLDNFHKGQCDALLSLVSNPNFEFQYGDVTNYVDCKNAINGVDGIIHLAAIVGFPACKRQPALSKAVNVDGTQNIVNLRNEYACIPLVYASTGSVYGKVENICTEESQKLPQSIYGMDKLSAEDIVRNTNNTVSFRFATGFGLSPCMRVNLLVNDFVYRAMTEKTLTVFQADFRRTFIHVQDMASLFEFGLRKLLNKELKHKVYNAGSNKLNWTKRELAEYVRAKTGCYVTYAEVGEDPDQRDYEVDYSKLEAEGFKTEYTMEQGINELIKAAPLLQIRHQYE